MQSTGYYPTSQQAYLVQQQQHQQQQQQQQQTSPLPHRPQALNQVIMEEPLEGDEEDDEEEEKKPMRRSGRRKIKIEYIEDKTRRHITFSKRKAGIMKKAYELSTLTGTQVLLLVVSETGLVYTFTTPKLQPLVTKPEGKNLIQSCLNAPDTSLDTNPPSSSPSMV
ncbi:uncharacterized protein EV154DRAFT_491148 [Mucor mucedo]|uniref:uncharacterized protein n=1 Tax=Mucor mucedo TaxID=29922 RepID=UPI00221F38E6|nr:uncharacterized protein EV154DRAFT_491148 [Mucor mucedo]KAI7896891.1 hypothetical protein EV154DRAFT_491148 [Mucor mucedo]